MFSRQGAETLTVRGLSTVPSFHAISVHVWAREENVFVFDKRGSGDGSYEIKFC